MKNCLARLAAEYPCMLCLQIAVMVLCIAQGLDSESRSFWQMTAGTASLVLTVTLLLSVFFPRET